MGGVDSERLLEDAKAGIADDVKGEEAGRADAAVVPEPNEEGRQRQVPDQLIEKGGLERGEGLIARGPVSG